MKNTVLILLLLVSVSLSAQILQTEASNTSGSNSMAFIDGSSAVNYNAFPGAGKGILFPRTDLTVIAQADVFDATSLSGSASYNPNYYDGLIVFNTGTGAIPATGMGTSADDVYPGFYFYRNTGTAWNTGVWIPMNGGNAPVTITEGTSVATHVTTNTGVEHVISLTGSADGVSTHIDLGTTILAANTVKQFRKAIVYDATGYLVIVATGSYDVKTNKFVTGNGMTNILLPAAEDYKVELYYSENIEEEGF